MKRSVVFTVLMMGWTSSAQAGISPERLALLRHDLGRYELRMRVDSEAYVIQGARLDSAGIAFDPDRIECVSRWRLGEKIAPEPLASPVTWERIAALERRDSGWRRGALIGLLVVPVAVYVAQSNDDPEGWAPLMAIGSAPFGALAGSLAGALGSTWVPIWQRPLPAGGESR